ncbi:MAG: hypothetical protein HY690_19080 [Chloroflexi bacterium]|nr:hypothetical protein [Chloroflexota bacterium]
MRRRIWALTLAACLALAACAPAASATTTVTGPITELDAAGLTSVRGFSLRDGQGNTWTFTVSESATDEDGRPVNASHLREHMALGDPVTVQFQREGDTLVARRVGH